MIYTDQELVDWWENLDEASKEEIFQKMITRTESESFARFAESLRNQDSEGRTLSPKQLSAIRKWAKE